MSETGVAMAVLPEAESCPSSVGPTSTKEITGQEPPVVDNLATDFIARDGLAAPVEADDLSGEGMTAMVHGMKLEVLVSLCCIHCNQIDICDWEEVSSTIDRG